MKRNRYVLIFLLSVIAVVALYITILLKIHIVISAKLSAISFYVLQLVISSISNAILLIETFLDICIDWYSSFTPNISFLANIVTFSVGLGAVGIPLILDIVSRISERYQSGVITNLLNQRWEIKLLPMITILEIVIAILFSFFVNDSNVSAWSKFFAYIEDYRIPVFEVDDNNNTDSKILILDKSQLCNLV